MKTACIVGGGIGGLTTGAFLARDGWDVHIFDKNSTPGGLCAPAEKNGYKWEQGQLILGDMLPGEDIYEMLRGFDIKLSTLRADRGLEMPDFALWKPAEYEGLYWRRERLKELFPEDAEGLDEYYRLYDNMVEIRYLTGLLTQHENIILKLKLLKRFLKIRKYQNLTAQELVEKLFKNEKLYGVFTGIFCDFCASPTEVPGIGIPFTNFEAAFDKRIPLKKHGKPYHAGFCTIKGGVQKLPEALADYISAHGGTIHLNCVVDKVLIENGCAVGVRLENGDEYRSDVVVGSGASRDFFYKTVGREYLSDIYTNIIDSCKTMESVFMVHLGLDFDPLEHLNGELCYYYGCYDMPSAVEKMRQGIYHEGNDGYLIFVPSAHAPEFAPEGHHCMTIYTVAPDTLADGDWESRKEYYANRLIQLAQQHLPGLIGHICEKKIMAAPDFRHLTHSSKFSFGGNIPINGQRAPGHTTPVKGLYFVGQQSESGGGIGAVMKGAKSAYDKMLETWKYES